MPPGKQDVVPGTEYLMLRVPNDQLPAQGYSLRKKPLGPGKDRVICIRGTDQNGTGNLLGLAGSENFTGDPDGFQGPLIRRDTVPEFRV